MKYIPAEKLKYEIERRIKEYDAIIESQPESNRAERDSWKWAECKWVLNLITFLQQEQQDNEDIDKVAQELYEHLYELKRRNNVPTNLYDKQEIIALWKAGIEYAYNHPKQEQPMPDSTKLIELWNEDKEMLKEKDFRDDPWRLAYNAFMCGFGRGIAVNKQEQQSIETETIYDTHQYTPKPSVGIEDVARVQFASHVKVFDKKRKAVFDWEQFKEVAGIFYGFGKKDLALTWQDVAKIITIYEQGIDNGNYRRYNEAEWMKEYSQDILRKFNEY